MLLGSKGCALCCQGAKMVLFITGRCHRSCWYCPISRERSGQDVIYANDRPIRELPEIIEEAEQMSALGTGITGGEPMLVLDRVVEACTLLKGRFGSQHHIHLYTGTAPGESELLRLQGLVDEIRMHPPGEVWHCILETPYARSARLAKSLGFDVGIEVPSLPNLSDLAPMLPLLDFLNINELEWGEISADEMRRRGLEPADGLHNAVSGAHRWAAGIRREKKVHWCTSAFKDSVQLRERLKRIAKNTARSFEQITEDGTVVYGVAEIAGEPVPARPYLKRGSYQMREGRLELSAKVLRRHADDLPGNKYIIERYPNGGIVVEVIPL